MNRGKHLLFAGLVVAFAGYSAAVYSMGTRQETEMDDSARRGRLLWQAHNCAACHQLYGLGGYLGPDLTNVVSAQGKGEAYARAIIASGPAQMPRFELSDGEIDDLVRFLSYVDATGRFPNHEVESTWYGSFRLERSR